MDASDPYNGINTALLVFGIISSVLFVISETLGIMNKFSTKCTSIIEFVLKGLNLMREPSLEERLEYLQMMRAQSA